MRIYLVRHGATLANDEQRFTGHLDVPLSEAGEQQAAATAEWFRARALSLIVSSDLRRAERTAHIIAHHHGMPVVKDADLRELSMGDWEGWERAAIQASDPTRYSSWRRDPVAHAAPGGETLSDLSSRVGRALLRYRQSHAEHRILWVTHSGVIRAFLCKALGLHLTHWEQFRISNGSITAVDITDDKTTFRQVNATDHLVSSK